MTILKHLTYCLIQNIKAVVLKVWSPNQQHQLFGRNANSQAPLGPNEGQTVSEAWLCLQALCWTLMHTKV